MEIKDLVRLELTTDQATYPARAAAKWYLELEHKKIVVNSRMETNLPGVFAAGDLVTYPGKIKLIATGFAEAAIAVKGAIEYIRPSEKLRLPYSSITGLPKKKVEVTV